MSFVEQVKIAKQKMNNIVVTTDLQFNESLSNKYNCQLYIKREDQQKVRSFKIRGAFNKIINLNDENKSKGVVCASAGNHAQGFAYTCHKLQVKGYIFLPETTPKQKIDRIKYHSQNWCQLYIIGSTFSETLEHSLGFCQTNDMTFVHPYDDMETIIGQATIGYEILNQLDDIDYIICPIGGGGLISGIGQYVKSINPNIKIIGVEPIQCPSMKESLKQNSRININCSDSFVDGATVSQVGIDNFKICKTIVDDILLVSNGRLCSEMVDLYQNEGLVIEPAGALSMASLDQLDLNNKTVVCLLSGANNDIMRYPDIVNKSQIYKNLRHYILVKFVQKPGQLKEFLVSVLGPNDDIIRFEYLKKTNNNFGNVLVGIEVANENDILNVYSKMEEKKLIHVKINENDQLFEFLI